MLDTARDIASSVLFLGSGFFFIAGSIGLVRFPDVFARLHAITKSDNLGLGLLIAGLAIQATDWMTVLKLVVIWMLVLFASATSSFLVANTALDAGIKPQRGDQR